MVFDSISLEYSKRYLVTFIDQRFHLAQKRVLASIF